MEEPQIAECRLDLIGLRSQRERYRLLGLSAERVERSGGHLIVEFVDGVDEELVRDTIAVERSCCPFFALRYDAARQRLHVSVADPQHEPALDALVFALGDGDA